MRPGIMPAPLDHIDSWIFDLDNTLYAPSAKLFDLIDERIARLIDNAKHTLFVQNDYQVLVRTHYDRYIGEFVIHCHILDHEDGGMMTNIQIVPDLKAVGGGIGMTGMKHTSIQPPAPHQH